MSCCLKITCMKTATYAVMHFVVAISVAYFLTRDFAMALAIGLLEPFIQTFAFAIHERLWNRATAQPTATEGIAATPLSGGTGSAAAQS